MTGTEIFALRIRGFHRASSGNAAKLTAFTGELGDLIGAECGWTVAAAPILK
jgi:hypothetical protein